MAKTHAKYRGIALIESVVAIAIVAIAATAIMAQISQANVQSGRSLLQSEAGMIAAAYLAEITARPFADPDGADGEALRRQYDDVDDYRGLDDPGPRDATGAALPGMNRYRVQVALANTGALPGVVAADVLRVTVTVTDPEGNQHLATGYRLAP